MSSADGERGAPPMVAEHTLAYAFLIYASQLEWSKWGVCYVPLRATIGVLYNSCTKTQMHSRKA